MFGDIFQDISPDTIIYAVLAIVVYSGLGSWLIGRLTRSRIDARRDARADIAENLGLMERMHTVQNQMSDVAKKGEFQQMWERLRDETTGRIAELNAAEETEIADPSAKYLILPTPRTAFGAVLSLVFAVCVYFSIAALVALAVLLVNNELDLLGTPDDLDYTVKVVGFSAVLMGVAFLARFGAFRTFRSFSRRQAERAAAKLRTDRLEQGADAPAASAPTPKAPAATPKPATATATPKPAPQSATGAPKPAAAAPAAPPTRRPSGATPAAQPSPAKPAASAPSKPDAPKPDAPTPGAPRPKPTDKT